MSLHRAAFANRAASVALVAAALSLAAAAHAEVNFSIGVGGPVYEQPAPVYVNPPPVYYQPAPPPHYRQAQPYYPQPAERPRLSDMQQRALDNSSLLAPREQGRCRATVLSTTR